MRRLLLPLFLLVDLAAAIFIVATSESLPARVASHFAAGGQANGWMPRGGYVGFMLAMAVVVPWLLVLLLSWLPRRFAGAVNLPHRGYWLDPERREATLASLGAFAAGFGCVLALLIAGVHRAIVLANGRTPPALDAAELGALLAGSAVALAAWLVAWYLRFRRPR
ncbi:MAG TPA: DUF1648 domain-containing protein [Casimicrobiaceae bacterium]|nr:DUF1648 domain-containing protein [Casimicrobiaceae bacterium]